MKKLTVLIFIVFSTTMHAQPHFGLKAGGNLAALRGNAGSQPAPRIGFHAGGFAAVPLAGGLHVVPELQFSLQGNKQGPYLLNLGYINMPLLLQYLTKGGFYVEVGPQAGLLVRARLKGPVNQDAAAKFSSLDIGGCLGLGYKEKHGFGIGARYILGFSNIAAANYAPAKNGVVQLSVLCGF